MSRSSERRLLEAARRCDGRAIEEIVRAGKTNLNAVDQVTVMSYMHPLGYIG